MKTNVLWRNEPHKLVFVADTSRVLPPKSCSNIWTEMRQTVEQTRRVMRSF